MHGVKTAILEIANSALVIPWAEFENFVTKCLYLKCYECAIMKIYSIMSLSLFQIQNLCQLWAKR